MVVNWKVKMGKDQWGKKERSKEVRIGVERNKKKDQQQWGITPIPIRMVILKKNLQTINAGEDMEKREPSYTVGGNVNWYSHYGEQYGEFLKKLETELPYDPAILLWASTLRKLQF